MPCPCGARFDGTRAPSALLACAGRARRVHRRPRRLELRRARSVRPARRAGRRLGRNLPLCRGRLRRRPAERDLPVPTVHRHLDGAGRLADRDSLRPRRVRPERGEALRLRRHRRRRARHHLRLRRRLQQLDDRGADARPALLRRCGLRPGHAEDLRRRRLRHRVPRVEPAVGVRPGFGHLELSAGDAVPDGRKRRLDPRRIPLRHGGLEQRGRKLAQLPLRHRRE